MKSHQKYQFIRKADVLAQNICLTSNTLQRLEMKLQKTHNRKILCSLLAIHYLLSAELRQFIDFHDSLQLVQLCLCLEKKKAYRSVGKVSVVKKGCRCDAPGSRHSGKSVRATGHKAKPT